MHANTAATTISCIARLRGVVSSPYTKIAYGGLLFAALFMSCSLLWNFVTTLVHSLLSHSLSLLPISPAPFGHLVLTWQRRSQGC